MCQILLLQLTIQIKSINFLTTSWHFSEALKSAALVVWLPLAEA